MIKTLSTIAALLLSIGVYAQDITVSAPQTIKCGAQVSKGETRCYGGAKINELMYIDPRDAYAPFYVIDGTYKANHIQAQPKTQLPDNIICPSHVEIVYMNVDYPQLSFWVYSVAGVYADTDSNNWSVQDNGNYRSAYCELGKKDCPLVYRAMK